MFDDDDFPTKEKAICDCYDCIKNLFILQNPYHRMRTA